MKTLYDVLGVCPDDGADALKRAFRNGIRASHPDVHPGDPDAPVRFRQVVKAYTILRDPETRADYDRLLELEREQLHATPRRYTVRKFVLDGIAAASLAAVMAGGYTLLVDIPSSVGVTEVLAVPRHGPTNIDGLQPSASTDTTNQGKPRGKLADVEDSRNTATAPSRLAFGESVLETAANRGDAPGNAHVGPASSAARADVWAASIVGAFGAISAVGPPDHDQLRSIGTKSSVERDNGAPPSPSPDFARSRQNLWPMKPREAAVRPPTARRKAAHDAHSKRVWLAGPSVAKTHSKKAKARRATTTQQQYGSRHAKVRVTHEPDEKPCAARTWAGCQGWDPDPNVRAMIQMDGGRDDK
jgi:hypothetical protein